MVTSGRYIGGRRQLATSEYVDESEEDDLIDDIM